MRSLILVVLAFLATGCASITPNVNTFSGCNGRIVIRDAGGRVKADLQKGQSASINMKGYHSQQLFTADMFPTSGDPYRLAARQFYADTYRNGMTYPSGSNTPDGYNWSFAPDAQGRCRESYTTGFGGSSGGGASAWGNPGPAW